MRALLIVASVLAFATSALAAEALPNFKKYTPYPAVRAQLIKMGYTPVRVQTKPGSPTHCHPEYLMCRTFPEIVSCTGAGMLFCDMLFKRRSDGHLLVVTTGGEPLRYKTPPDFTTVGFVSASRPDAGHLKDVVIASDEHRDRR
jgi:hypothetical protein